MAQITARALTGNWLLSPAISSSAQYTGNLNHFTTVSGQRIPLLRVVGAQGRMENSDTGIDALKDGLPVGKISKVSPVDLAKKKIRGSLEGPFTSMSKQQSEPLVGYLVEARDGGDCNLGNDDTIRRADQKVDGASKQSPKTSSMKADSTKGNTGTKSPLRSMESKLKPKSNNGLQLWPPPTIGRLIDDLAAFVTPRENGDIRDVTLICLSFAILVYISQKLVCAYCVFYYSFHRF